MSAPIVFFDGVCNLCNGFVDFVIQRDPDGAIKFASLQGETAKEMLDARATEVLESVVVWQDDQVYERSDAVIRLAPYLPAPWRWVGATRWIPRILRDAVYRLVARYRYLMFGKKETCRVPTPEERARFLP